MNQTAKQIEEVILEYERRWGYDALEDLKPLVRFGGFKIDNAQDYRAYKLDDIAGRMSTNGTENSGGDSELPNGEGSIDGAGQAGSVKSLRMQRSLPIVGHAVIVSKIK